jgi:hypothetical protein
MPRYSTEEIQDETFLPVCSDAHAVVRERRQRSEPVMDMIANKVTQKYQNSTCEQLWEQKAKKAPPSQQEQQAIQMLKSDPQMRAAFIDKIAAPIANKMFDCGMIP